MAHSRKSIRDAVVALLTGNTTAGDNVYANRETSLWESELPAILVYTRDETAEPRSVSRQQSIRTLNLSIEIKTEANDTVDDNLDSLAEEVEAIIAANPNLSASALQATYQSTIITLDASSETEKGVAVLNFEVKYIK